MPPELMTNALQGDVTLFRLLEDDGLGGFESPGYAAIFADEARHQKSSRLGS